MKILPKSELLKALKEAQKKYKHLKIGASNNSLLEYEKLGVVKKPETMIGVGGSKAWRFYTQQEIDDTVKQVIIYKMMKIAVIEDDKKNRTKKTN